MPRVNHTAQSPAVTSNLDTLPVGANLADLTFTAADATNKEQVNHAANLLIIAWNSGVSTRTVTITSKALRGRTGDHGPYSLEAGDHAVFGPYEASGWRQTDGKLYHEASHLDVKFAYLLV